MSLLVHPARVDGTVRAPSSKSYTHRAFLLAALSGNGLVRHALHADDTEATLDALRGLGCLVSKEAQGTRVGGVLKAAKAPLDVRNSGTTLRLLTPIAALLASPTTITGGPSLTERPIEPLLEALRQLGCRAQSTNGKLPLTVQGPLRGGTCRIPGDISSQFISGLLLATPFAAQETRIELTSPLTSRPYVEITLALLRERGIRIQEDKQAFVVPPQQRLRQKPFDVPGDYSSAAFLLAAAAVTSGRVRMEGLSEVDEQGDRAFLEHLETFGCRVEREVNAVTVEGAPLRAATIDVGATPDLFPILCVLGACARGTTRLHGAPHLRVKESDRVRAMHENLAAFGIASRERADGLEIDGGTPKGTRIRSFNDHRIAMACLVLGLRAAGSTELPDLDVVNKSYPNFSKDLLAIAPGVVA